MRLGRHPKPACRPAALRRRRSLLILLCHVPYKDLLLIICLLLNLYLQFLLLTKRAQANMWRNPLVLKGKIAQTLFLSLIVGLIYLQVNS